MEGLPCPPPGHLPNPGTEPASPALAAGFFTTEPPKEPWRNGTKQKETKSPKGQAENPRQTFRFGLVVLQTPTTWESTDSAGNAARWAGHGTQGPRQALLTARAQIPQVPWPHLVTLRYLPLSQGLAAVLSSPTQRVPGGSSLGTVNHSALSKANSRDTKHKGQQMLASEREERTGSQAG